MSSVYLTGDTIETAALASLAQPDWRTLAMTKLSRYGMRVINPIEWAWTTAAEQAGSEKRVRRALDLIDQCDLLLANLNASNYGTAMEMFYAHRQGKPVTVVGQSPFNPWVLSHSQARFAEIEEALDYLIGQQPQHNPLEWALKYEAFLSMRYEQLPPDGEPDYQFLGGELPILVLAPHATAFFKEGIFQEPDTFTGCIAASLNHLTRCHALVSSFCSVADPCWHLETPMIRALADITKAGQIGLIVIVLGSSWHESPGLLLEAVGSHSLLEDFSARLKWHLAAVELVGNSSANYPIKPLIYFVSENLKIPTLVLKTHRRYRMPRLQPEPFLQVLSRLSEFLIEAGVELTRNRK